MSVERQLIAHCATWPMLTMVGIATVLTLQACLGTSAVPANRPIEQPSEPRIASPAPLRGFFAALNELDRHQARRPLRIMQIGDSHTANDALSGRMRERFQARFGAAGRGWLPAGIPFRYFQPHLVSVSETDWHHYRPSDKAGIPLGLDAVDAQSLPPESGMTIESTETAGFDRFAVEFLTRPRGSPFTIQIDGGKPIRVSTAAASTAAKGFDLPLDHPAHRAELRTAGRPPIDLLGWTVERRAPGIIYENHGTIGATVNLLAQISQAAVSFELDQRRPALIMIVFGTNEGFDDGLGLSQYAARFHAEVAALQRHAPGAAILVVGPPDSNRVAQNCPSTNGAAASCRPDAASGDRCAWHEPIKLAAVRSIQRRIAAQQGWAYWDWFEAMGGDCSIDRMAGADPPLAMPDHVHLNKSGYETIADLLFTDLMSDYDRWRTRNRR